MFSIKTLLFVCYIAYVLMGRSYFWEIRATYTHINTLFRMQYLSVELGVFFYSLPEMYSKRVI